MRSLEVKSFKNGQVCWTEKKGIWESDMLLLMNVVLSCDERKANKNFFESTDSVSRVCELSGGHSLVTIWAWEGRGEWGVEYTGHISACSSWCEWWVLCVDDFRPANKFQRVLSKEMSRMRRWFNRYIFYDWLSFWTSNYTTLWK